MFKLFRAVPLWSSSLGRIPFTVTLGTLRFASHTSGAITQLRRVAELQERVRATNSNIEKQRIIADFPDLRGLLEQVYHPKFRTHLSSATLDTYLSSPSTPKDPPRPPTDIGSLFTKLASRSVTGNAPKELVRAFLLENGIITSEIKNGGEGIADADSLAVFKRLLDRNLVAGFGARTLSEIRWEGDRPHRTTIPPHVGSLSKATPSSTPVSTEIHATPNQKSMKEFKCALGKTVLATQIPSLFTPASPIWYVSRKLDGVRVITFLDFIVPTDPNDNPRLVNVQHLSRTGNPFTSLGNLYPQLAAIERYPDLREKLEKDLSVESEGQEGGTIKRLVLDGEICIMRPNSSQTTPINEISLDIVNEIEDFASTVSEVRRQNHTMVDPGYYLFDLLSWADFSGHRSAEKKKFGERVRELHDLSGWLRDQPQTSQVYNGIKALTQDAVGESSDVSRVEDMIHYASASSWEGLILRADKPYKGSRSSDVRKFKQWLDAEYTVRSIETSRQRLAIDGFLEEYEAVAALIFHHKGHPVSVSSGMTAEQRITWAKNPEKIIGRQMTVEYFSETEAVGREGVPSLRFPRIKAIWDGKRDV